MPSECENMEIQWLAPWNTTVSIQSYVATLKDIYEMAVASLQAYTQEQMIGKVINSVENFRFSPPHC